MFIDAYTLPWLSSHTSTFDGRSIASVGDFTIIGVPTFGLPKTITLAAGMSSECCCAAFW